MDDEEYYHKFMGSDMRRGEYVDSVYWRYDLLPNGGAVVVSGPECESAASPCCGHVCVPNELGGHPVVGIGNNAFYCLPYPEAVDKLSIPSSVREIGYRVVAETSKAISCKDGLLYIDNWCTGILASCSRRVSIPFGVVGLAEGAFRGSSIECVDIPSTVKYVNKYVFSGCKKLRRVNFTGPVSKIDSCAFYDCKVLDSVSFNANVSEIAHNAFEGANPAMTINVNPLHWGYHPHFFLGHRVMGFEQIHLS